MKREIITLFFINIFINQIISQDIIFYKNGLEIKSKIVEITDSYIKYRKYENINGPIYNAPNEEVFMVLYENGHKQMIKVNKLDTSANKLKSQLTNYDSNISIKHKNEKQKSFTISSGVTGLIGKIAYNSTLNDNIYIQPTTIFIGPVSITANRKINKKINWHLGISLSHLEVCYKENVLLEEFLGFSAIIPGIDIGGSFHFLKHRKVDPYLKIVSGLTYWFPLNKNYELNAVTPNYGLRLGVNVFRNNGNGINIEAGYDRFSYLMIGYTFGH